MEPKSIIIFSMVFFIFLTVFEASAESVYTNLVSDSENYTGYTGPVFEPKILDNPECTKVQKKLSSDLLQLTNTSFLPPNSSRKNLIKQMEKLHQIIHVDGGNVSRGNNETWEKEAFNNEKLRNETRNNRAIDYQTRHLNKGLVHVYVRFYPGSDPASADSYLESVTARDEGLIAAWVKISSLETLAGLKTVRNIRTVMPPFRKTGTYVTEGDFIHNCDDVRAKYGLTGKGIKIGIISDGVDNLDMAVASGDLPDNVTILSNTQGGDEGTAMLEIVHDIAPEAGLYFHDSGDNVIAFNAAIDALVAAGCDIVCDDIGWIAEPFFEDGPVASHVQEVIEQEEILYVSAAGNDALNHYQGKFYPDEFDYHDFSEGKSDRKNLYVNLPPDGIIIVVLQWNDSWDSSSNNYDLYLWDLNKEEIVASSTLIQNGSGKGGPPLEFLVYGNFEGTATDVAVLVNKHEGRSRILEVYLYPSGAILYSDNFVLEDSIFGHPAASWAVSVGAIDADDPENDDIEPYSSLGPVSIFYPVFELREKPEISGIDGVQVSGAGVFPSTFFGTSASAPHIAGLAGLIWSANPEKSSFEVREALLSTATDRGPEGYDTVFGYGIADALAMYEELVPEVPGPTPIQAPVANFTVNMTAGPAPLTVRFTDFSENASFWQWDIDGDFVVDYTLQDPVHTYTEPGLYTVSLTVNNTAGSDTLEKPDYINVTKKIEDWNPWNDPGSEGREAITTGEVQAAIDCWLNDKPAPKTGGEVTLERLQELIYTWLNG